MSVYRMGKSLAWAFDASSKIQASLPCCGVAADPVTGGGAGIFADERLTTAYRMPWADRTRKRAQRLASHGRPGSIDSERRW
jgi:hypothetical protein